MHFPSELSPEHLTILIDDREKLPLAFPGFKTEVVRLNVGDYALKGLEEFVRAERKTLNDLAYYLNGRRNKLEDQIRRLLKFPHRILFIEATALDLEQGHWPNAHIATPQLVQETIASWRARGLQIEYSGTHARASEHAADYLLRIANYYYETHRPFFDHLFKAPDDGPSQSAIAININTTDDPPAALFMGTKNPTTQPQWHKPTAKAAPSKQNNLRTPPSAQTTTFHLKKSA